ncbi:MAG TPA: tagaturonate epimerase family protein, partial [Anaerolineales bacterium]|nr:tagaturonate epimerase family protein [Anaerolineales bacterium]
MHSQLSTTRLNLYPKSLTLIHDTEYGLAQTSSGQRLAVLAQPGSHTLDEFEGENSEFDQRILKICPLNSHNAAISRKNLPWLKPKLLGLNTSAGLGDRLGIATPGHVRAVRFCQGKVIPIFAQQSIREMARTERSPEDVLTDAT